MAGESKALGYPKKACGFSEKTTGGYNHSDPTSFGVQDFSDLELALVRLKNEHFAQYIAMAQYYKPWIVKAMIKEGWPFNNSTYYKRLHSAHGNVASYMDESKAKKSKEPQYA